MIHEVTSFLISIILVSALVFGWMSAAHSLRVGRVRRQYENLSKEARQRILNRIDEVGRAGSTCCVLVAAQPDPDQSASRAIDGSRYGGTPYAERNQVWPAIEPEGVGSLQPADFLIQVLLEDSFPSPWVGRLVVIFNHHDVDQTVRCYLNPSRERYVALTGGPETQREWTLQSVRIPTPPAVKGSEVEEADGAQSGLLSYDPVVLLETVPGLQEDLALNATQPADLLAAVLAPNHCGYGFELSDIVQLGGQPVWLYPDMEGLVCDQCHRSMRFLFQFGDLNRGNALGDSGVCYVFGCDEHPDQPRGIVQMC